MIGGNIGQPPWDPALDGTAYDYWVIETSSYQATDLACSPPVVAVTSLHPDHLPWHGGRRGLLPGQAVGHARQPGADLTVANGDSDLLRERAALLGPRVAGSAPATTRRADWMAPLGLLGAHNRRNALIARACLRALGVPQAADEAALRAAAAGFEHAGHRLQAVGTVDGVTFVDDSLSTNVLPTLAALDAFPGRRVALIAGGQDRGIDYAPLAAGLAPRTGSHPGLRCPTAAPGRGRPRDPARRRNDGRPPPRPRRRPRGLPCADLDAAVRAGFAWARPGRDGAAVPRRAELRPVPRLPRPGRRLRPRHARLRRLLTPSGRMRPAPTWGDRPEAPRRC